MIGCRSGFMAGLKAEIPHLLYVHCLAHKENLAASQAVSSFPKLVYLDKLCRSIYAWLHASGKRMDDFRLVEGALNLPELAMLRIHSVRWWSRGQVMERMVKIMPALLLEFGKEKPSIYDELTVYGVQFFIHLQADVCIELNVLNCHFQSELVDIANISSYANATLQNLEKKFLRDSFGCGTKYLHHFGFVTWGAVTWLQQLSRLHLLYEGLPSDPVFLLTALGYRRGTLDMIPSSVHDVDSYIREARFAMICSSTLWMIWKDELQQLSKMVHESLRMDRLMASKKQKIDRHIVCNHFLLPVWELYFRNLDCSFFTFLLNSIFFEKLRDNIGWEKIADTLDTHNHGPCCCKWYYNLQSSLVSDGHWANQDDFLLLESLLESGASAEEEVEWDGLLEHRSGQVCLTRWKQMVKHLGENRTRQFLDKLEILAQRYAPDLLETSTVHSPSKELPADTAEAI
ncbi:hypothetical protein L7F22_034368 [Adiantum nelumboides]|nr:hypothetical protein [Adiantum nelumboides]